ncbi:hypothetical protein [Parapedobacter lycopersici]|uniref:hypothetical protein n=1 Tax=Parapedobacter lycopersici TaxID=1864939 RepID=UPI00214D176F|nr:hypothetical protein [Parapedobacter lycopersici]
MMKFLFLPLLFLLPGLGASAQFAGYYIAPAKTDGQPEVRLVIEEVGRYHLFANERYYQGKWHSLDKQKAELVIDNPDAVELYVSTGNENGGQILFTGFGDQQAFFQLGSTGSFRPIFKEEPTCPYSNTQQLGVYRSDFDEVTVAINRPADQGDSLTTLYTYQIPKEYDELYVDVNSIATYAGKKLTLEQQDNQYVVEGISFEKQPDSTPILKVLVEQLRLLHNVQVDHFKMVHYLQSDRIKRITPRISRRVIRTSDVPIFSIECPDVNDFPVEAPMPPR